MQRARRALVLYLGAVFTLCGAIDARLVSLGGRIEDHRGWIAVAMWTPGLVSFALRLAQREGFGDVSFRVRLRRGVVREWLIAWLSPVAVCTIAYGVAWSTGLAQFVVHPGLARVLPGISAPLALIASVLLQLLVSPPFAALTAAGEEFGWRGYMLTRLFDARVPHPILVSGLIWAAWHAPLILTGQYAAGPYPLLSAVLFAVSITAQSFVFARVRLETGSVWAPVLLHSTWNAVIQGGFDRGTGVDPGAAQALWVGESGVLVCAVTVALSYALYRWVPRAAADPQPRPAYG